MVHVCVSVCVHACVCVCEECVLLCMNVCTYLCLHAMYMYMSMHVLAIRGIVINPLHCWYIHVYTYAMH